MALCREDPEAAADRMLMLWAMVAELAAVVATQGEEIARLKAKLAKDSHNSSKPPSSDRHNPGGSEPGKGKGKRGKKRKPGGQPGREGKTLRKVRKPDHIVELAAPARCNCGSELSGLAPSGVRTRQVFDLPEEVRVEVTEYRAPVCTCPGCGEKCAGEFPVGVAAPVQYGPRVRALATYLHAYHLLPFERLSEFFADVFGCPVATGTLSGFVDDAGARADPVHERTREQVRGSSCMHNDESGLSILGKMAWLHVACTKEATFFEVTPGRSFEDIRSVGVLEGYTGRSVHDFLPAYLKFDGPTHGLCNAHHLRELTYIEEELGQAWAGEMKALLLHAKRRVEAQATGGRKVGAKTIAGILEQYEEILAAGFAENPEPVRRPGQRGRLPKGKALNLLERFAAYHDEILAYLLHGAPFDNNEAERDLRMIKTRQKISGCFRSLETARCFAKVRTVITTAKKRGVRVYEVLQVLFSDPIRAEAILFGT